ncbi:hypothetical protein [Candidatus Sodalis sp. SoCistrobi]|uniref:hypothetical protein n=1 Tax=Candidatus Sodalis sp. SoCistrobi TaxID=1922216 RepID=UPI0015754C34|nr:hypothetical protein [Candidatus Sodalis sp. SoCistrobi]
MALTILFPVVGPAPAAGIGIDKQEQAMTKITGKRPGAVYFVWPLGALMALIGLALTA